MLEEVVLDRLPKRALAGQNASDLMRLPSGTSEASLAEKERRQPNPQ